MHTVALVPHPSTPWPQVRELSVRVDALGEDHLVFYYRIEGDIDQLQLPAQQRSGRADGLWQHTCFEAFIKAPGARAYYEFNFSPSSEWAAYGFEDYRQGMTPLDLAHSPKVICRRRGDRLEADVDISLAGLESSAGSLAGDELQLALCAVLESRQGEISYWALAHPGGKPDFHHAKGFVLSISPGAGEAR